MPKKFIQRIMPSHESIRNSRSLKIFGSLLHDANLWHLNRRSAAGAFAVGLFFAFIPVPFQMLLAAAAAIPLRVNLPLSVALVWVSNPITMPVLFYFCYLLGAWVLDQGNQPFAFELSWSWLAQSIGTIGPAFLLGCFIVAVLVSIIGYISISLLWRQSVVNAWRARAARMLAAAKERAIEHLPHAQRPHERTHKQDKRNHSNDPD
ncbi:hypothetical protein DFO79_10383 [Pseudidiomarina tainanensis]|uniref:DUF2062 domain-containing protein n=2 Tax=Pseudidiomarina TaxID=2800384 RepID=A0A368V5Q1_9GAMM|nr:hypothetical protein DET45_103159 [Pseudidiomarina maritima]RBP92533.1 hypothetical protein DFO81_10283 [Pseudidiomarina tainanensis]RCW34341.1 hypothetical protein DFO79_10383 [Pseudidiomarina tainanensis]